MTIPVRVARPNRLRRDMRASVADGTAFSLTVGLGESYLPAFVLAVGLGEVTAGLIATVPLFVGSVVQLVSPHAVRRVGSHRRWVLACATLQALSFVPLVVGAAMGHISTFGVLLAAALYWSAGMSTGPAWNTWIGRLVPRSVRTRFFATRTLITQLAVMTGLLVGGVVLQMTAARGLPLLGFALLFAAAGAFRLISAAFLAAHREAGSTAIDERVVSPREFLHRVSNGEARLLKYMFIVQLATQVAGPYFTPYMLLEAEFSYGAYVSLLATAFVTKIVVMPAFGRLAQRFGSRRLLWIGGFGIVPLAALWLISKSLAFLLIVQVFAGMAWGAYELGTFLLLFDTIRDDERTSVLTTFNLFNAVAIVAGSLAGGLLLKVLAKQQIAYMLIFALSSLGRAMTIPLLLKITGVARRTVTVGIRTLAVRPSAGSFDAPVVASAPAQACESLRGRP
ncbi:MAG: MFS transporter [Phycisphaerales bacterium]|nr:MAG: MFS transporter [Phycisphaerales bacterium]